MPRCSHNIANRYKYQNQLMSTLVLTNVNRVCDFSELHRDLQESVHKLFHAIKGTGAHGTNFNELLTQLKNGARLITGESWKELEKRLASSLLKFCVKK